MLNTLYIFWSINSQSLRGFCKRTISYWDSLSSVIRLVTCRAFSYISVKYTEKEVVLFMGPPFLNMFIFIDSAVGACWHLPYCFLIQRHLREFLLVLVIRQLLGVWASVGGLVRSSACEAIGIGLWECAVPALPICSFVWSSTSTSEALWFLILQMWKLRFREVAVPAWGLT